MDEGEENGKRKETVEHNQATEDESTAAIAVNSVCQTGDKSIDIKTTTQILHTSNIYVYIYIRKKKHPKLDVRNMANRKINWHM